jgi:hypothetical protein
LESIAHLADSAPEGVAVGAGNVACVADVVLKLDVVVEQTGWLAGPSGEVEEVLDAADSPAGGAVGVAAAGTAVRRAEEVDEGDVGVLDILAALESEIKFQEYFCSASDVGDIAHQNKIVLADCVVSYIGVSVSIIYCLKIDAKGETGVEQVLRP